MESEPEAPVGLDLDSVSLAEAREWVRAGLTGHEGVTTEDAVLVADELVSNAWQHGLPPRKIHLGFTRGRERLRIEVDDASPERPVMRTPDDSGGRGLLLVQQLTAAWGTRHYHGRKTVWAELPMVRREQAGYLSVVRPERSESEEDD
ncbi:ATP-binding protein [Amycolatopsis pigmentata]|uniref:ATP-binding protein n=1 Tax=Amycolatopsis pigmentata TaxID=450801 RepID=A0ABW5G2D7_9PSEU